MSRPSSEFLVYACSSCGKRIFTDRSHQGRRGVCPVCGAAHEIGAQDPSVAAEKGVERRRSRRARARNGKVGLSGARSRGDVLGSAELYELHDLSATGVGFLVPGVPDARQLSGERPPPIKVGDQLLLTLHLPQLPAGRMLKAEVRRVAHGGKKLWMVGAQFQFASPTEQAELSAIIQNLS